MGADSFWQINGEKGYGRTTLPLLTAVVILALFLVGRTAASALGTILTVNTADDADDGNCDAAHCSLREAINTANNQSGPEAIQFTIPATSTIYLTPNTQLPVINDTLTISGNGLTVAADNGIWYGRVFEIETGASVTITHMTIRDGDLSGDIGAGFLNRGNLTLIESTVRNNRADSAGGGGGGIYNYGGNLTILRSTLFANYSGFGAGAIQNFYGTVIIDNSTISDNSSYAGIPGIINRGTLIIKNSTLGQNFGFDQDADLYNLQNLTMINSILATGCRSEGDIIVNIKNLVINGACEAEFGGDPRIEPLADNGGPTRTHALKVGSLAFNNADPAYCPETDQRGVPRPLGAGCEIGSYESELSPTAVSLTEFGGVAKQRGWLWIVGLATAVLITVFRIATRITRIKRIYADI